MSTHVRPTLVFTMPERGLFGSALVDQHGRTLVFVPGESAVAVASPVDVQVSFTHQARMFRLRGVVRYERKAKKHSLPSGVGVELDMYEDATRDLILAFSRGDNHEWTERSEPRFPIAHPIAFAAGDMLATETTTDISKSGAFITTKVAVKEGAQLDIKMKPEGELFALRFGAQVLRVDRKRGGIAVSFLFPSPHVQQRFEAFIDRMEPHVQRMTYTHGPDGRL
jgi:hypothetical protein